MCQQGGAPEGCRVGCVRQARPCGWSSAVPLLMGQCPWGRTPLYEDPREVDEGLALPHCDLIPAKCWASDPGSNEATFQVPRTRTSHESGGT